MMTRRSNYRPVRTRTLVRKTGESGAPPARRPISPRAVMLLLLCCGPIFLISLSFFFGVGLQALDLVGPAKHGGVLGGLGGMALTVLIGAFFCVPGYFLAVVWFGVKTTDIPEDIDALKNKIMSIPIVSLIMCWVPAVIIPNIVFGVRIQVAGLTVILMLTFGYLWILIVRIIIRAFLKRSTFKTCQ